MTNPSGPVPDACLSAHGAEPAEASGRSLVVVYAGELARHLAAMAGMCGFRTAVVEPDPRLAAAAVGWAGSPAASITDLPTDPDTDVVVTDHHRDDLGVLLGEALAVPTRWIGVIGNPRHPGPHVGLLTDLGVPTAEIARVHRPIGLNIGSRTPAEIAVSILAGLLADRGGRSGGFFG